MTDYPLVSHRSADAILAWQQGKSITVRQFLMDVHRLAAALPSGLHMLNACSDRYHFTVGLGAALLTRKISLLPPTHTPDMMGQLRAMTPDVFCLFDSPHQIDLPGFAYQEAFAQQPVNANLREATGIPRIPGNQPVADVFTSGSTGLPQAHRKYWGSLVQSARAEAQRLGLSNERPGNIVGTVPPQHMYGFESTLLMALHSGGAIHAGQPFYPADIAKAIRAVPQPRMLVTTPVHLRVLLDSGLELPALDLLLSATAPMSAPLAQQCETRFAAPLFEIYGATETGQIASRRTATSPEWELFPDVSLTQRDGRTWAGGGHVAVEMPMNDVLECIDSRRFLLHGRLADRINIAGKSNSLAHLNHQLCSIKGVQDGAFFMPDDSQSSRVLRLMAFAVAPGLTRHAIQSALKTRIGSAFMPRPLVLLDALPRNSTGKLPREALQSLADAHLAQSGNPGGLHAG
jgi:acyl-coenzyme A synthetase/AMP-(fatty) acid ligase